MINYLKGIPVEILKNTQSRIILILEVNSIGYEMQIPSRFARDLSVETKEIISLFTHLQIREDQPILYGFSSSAERDLFRQLISVSGIGSQLAIALIDTLGLEELVQAIVTGNTRILSKTPGVGQKTAERIALELKTKLSQWRNIAGVQTSTTIPIPNLEVIEDVEMTLLALGYTKDEIEQVLSVLSQDNQLLKNRNVEDWLKRALTWLTS
jgi:Holliday junction DNA helicase RuvA